MQDGINGTSSEPIELPAMLATLCSYEGWFGPYHLQTLSLMIRVGIAYWQAGEVQRARRTLERAVADLSRHFDHNHDLRLRAIVTLKDVLLAQGDYDRAAAVERELLECQIARLGSDHPDTLATRADLSMILLEKISCDSSKLSGNDDLGRAARLQLAGSHLVANYRVHARDVEISVEQADAGGAALPEMFLHVELSVAVGIAQRLDAALVAIAHGHDVSCISYIV
jgi:hypothetical protein